MHDDVKKGFLQACANHGSLSVKVVNDILTPLCESYEVEPPANDAELKDFVKELNSGIKAFNQALTFIQHPLVDKQFLVFGLTTESSVCKKHQHYTNAERHYFAKLLEKMVNQREYGLALTDLYFFENSSELQKQLPKTRMQELVKRWTQQGYFIDKGDFSYFGPRMLVEYSSHFKTHYSDLVQDCPLCRNLVFWDVECSECETKVHRDCIRKYLIRMSTCPSCSKMWNTPLSQPE